MFDFGCSNLGFIKKKIELTHLQCALTFCIGVCMWGVSGTREFSRDVHEKNHHQQLKSVKFALEIYFQFCAHEIGHSF